MASVALDGVIMIAVSVWLTVTLTLARLESPSVLVTFSVKV